MTKMDPELKAKWVKALRSGEYKQGQFDLYTEARDTYCCLGVLCVVGGISRRDINGFGFMSGDQCETLGIDRAEISKPEKESVYWMLAHMNDDGKSFAEIADLIEANL